MHVKLSFKKKSHCMIIILFLLCAFYDAFLNKNILYFAKISSHLNWRKFSANNIFKARLVGQSTGSKVPADDNNNMLFPSSQTRYLALVDRTGGWIFFSQSLQPFCSAQITCDNKNTIWWRFCTNHGLWCKFLWPRSVG